MPQVTYDPEADVLYVRLGDDEIAKQLFLDDLRIIDQSNAGTVVGVEFVGASGGVNLTDMPFAPTIRQLIDESGLPLNVFA